VVWRVAVMVAGMEVGMEVEMEVGMGQEGGGTIRVGIRGVGTEASEKGPAKRVDLVLRRGLLVPLHVLVGRRGDPFTSEPGTPLSSMHPKLTCTWEKCLIGFLEVLIGC
jgi:hypothetical protein